MHLRRIVTATLLATSLLFGQETSKPQDTSEFEAAIIPVKTLSGDSFQRLAVMLNVFGVKYHAEEKLRTILVYAPKDVIAKMRRVVEQLDQPGSEAAIGRNIEMTLAFLRCSTSPLKTESLPLPPDLEPAAKQLRAATQYKHIQLWDIVPLHMQEGRQTEHSFRLPHVVAELPNAVATANLRILPEAVIRKETGRFVRFQDLNIQFRIPYLTGPPTSQQYNISEVGLKTAGDFKEGQKTILGKISGIDADSAIFVVISLKVLD